MDSNIENPAEYLAKYALSIEYNKLSDKALLQAHRSFIDTIGVTIAGMDTEAGEKTVLTLKDLDQNSKGTASIIGQDCFANPHDAAFINATAGHALDFDDVSDPMNNHPSVTMVAPLLAVGERIGASGGDVLAAYVAGFEVQSRLSTVINPGHYKAGWHATGTLGTFGSATAVSNLLELSSDACQTALNISASLPGGLQRNFGSHTKPMHAGQAASSGLLAAYLAKQGFTANTDAFSGENGFFDIYTRPHNSQPGNLSEQDEPLHLIKDGIYMKKFPCCYFTHSAISAAIKIKSKRNIDPRTITSVTVKASAGAGDVLAYQNPSSELEAKFSMEYTVACALVEGNVGLDAFEDHWDENSLIEKLRESVTFKIDSNLQYDDFSSTVTVQTSNGRTYSEHVSKPPGAPNRPISEEELRSKFIMCAKKKYGRELAVTAYNLANTLDEQTDIGQVVKKL